MNINEYLISTIAPHHCLGCGSLGGLLCLTCQDRVVNAPTQCSSCKKFLPGCRVFCKVCSRSTDVKTIFAVTEYQAIAKQLIHGLKFERKRVAAEIIGTLMANRFSFKGVVVVPVPTATTRMRIRGYDQSVLIAKAYAKAANLPHTSLLLRNGRQRQLGNSREVRRAQLRSAFLATASTLPGRTPILLIDDVVTTGSSFSAAAQTLRTAGFTNISALAFASA